MCAISLTRHAIAFYHVAKTLLDVCANMWWRPNMATSSWNAAQTASEILKVVSTLAKVKQGEALLQPDLAEIRCGNRLGVFTLPVKHRNSFLTQLLLCFPSNSGMCFIYRVAKMCFVWKHLSTSEQHCTSMSLQELCNEKKWLLHMLLDNVREIEALSFHTQA